MYHQVSLFGHHSIAYVNISCMLHNMCCYNLHLNKNTVKQVFQFHIAYIEGMNVQIYCTSQVLRVERVYHESEFIHFNVIYSTYIFILHKMILGRWQKAKRDLKEPSSLNLSKTKKNKKNESLFWLFLAFFSSTHIFSSKPVNMNPSH